MSNKQDCINYIEIVQYINYMFMLCLTYSKINKANKINHTCINICKILNFNFNLSCKHIILLNNDILFIISYKKPKFINI